MFPAALAIDHNRRRYREPSEGSTIGAQCWPGDCCHTDRHLANEPNFPAV